MQTRIEFYHPEEILKDMEEQVVRTRDKDERVDYITLVPDRESTLDINLGKARASLVCATSIIRVLRSLKAWSTRLAPL